jgi:ATP-dependent protease Clp ATPase subunit
MPDLPDNPDRLVLTDSPDKAAIPNRTVKEKKKANPRKEVAILELGEAISSYLPPHHPSPFSSDHETKDYGAMLRDIRLQTKKVRNYIHLQTSYEPIRIVLKQGGIDTLKANDPQILPDHYIHALSLAAFADLISTHDYISTDHFANVLAPLVSEDSGSYIEGKLQARFIMSELLAKNILHISERFIILPARIREMLSGGNALNRPNLEEKHVKWFWLARQREKDLKKAQNTNNDKTPAPLNSPQDLYNRLTHFVIGQHEACKVLATRGWLHMKRAEVLKRNQTGSKATTATATGAEIGMSEATGPNECLFFISQQSGCGKTFLGETFGRICSLPYTSFSSTDATSVGYVGADIVEDSLKSLLKATGNPDDASTLSKMQHGGIVFYDEFTKKRALNGDARETSGGRDVSGVAVQQEVLRIMEGCKVQIGNRRGGDRDGIQEINTTGMMFLFGGFVDGFDAVISKLNKRKQSMGFGNGNGRGAHDYSNFRGAHDAYLYDAMVEYGFIPEFVNRLSKIVMFRKLTATDLAQIAMSPAGVIRSYNNLLSQSNQGLQIRVTQDGILSMADLCVETGLMARGLRLIVNSLVEDAVFNQVKGTVSFGVQEVRQAIDRVTRV